MTVIFICEKIPFANSQEEKLVLYDRVDLIQPDKEAELLEDLRKRLGLDIKRVQVGAVDFLHDTAMLKVYYRTKRRFGDNIINNMLKIPK